MQELYPKARWVEVWSGEWWLIATPKDVYYSKSVHSPADMELAEIEFLAGIIPERNRW